MATTKEFYDYLISEGALDKSTTFDKFHTFMQDRGNRERFHTYAVKEDLLDKGTSFQAFDHFLGVRNETAGEATQRIGGQALNTAKGVVGAFASGAENLTGGIASGIGKLLPGSDPFETFANQQKAYKKDVKLQPGAPTYVPQNTFEGAASKAKKGDILGATGEAVGAALEAGASSAPGMATMAVPGVGTPAFLGAQTENMANTRATNEGKQAPTAIDYAVAAPSAAVQAALEKIGLKKLTNNPFVAEVTDGLMKKLGKVGMNSLLKSVIEGSQEAGQQLVQYATEVGGTKAKFDTGEMLRQAAIAGAGGAAIGGTLGTAEQIVSPHRPKAFYKPSSALAFTGNTGSAKHYAGLNEDFRSRFDQMADEYKAATGKNIQVNSAFRSSQEQTNVQPTGGAPKAKGTSRHTQGVAIDINADTSMELNRMGLLQKYGFQNLASASDPQHIQNSGKAPRQAGVVLDQKAVQQEAMAMAPEHVQQQVAEATSSTAEATSVTTPEPTVQDFVDRIVAGEQMQNPEDVQFYQNNSQAIESELFDRKNAEVQSVPEKPAPDVVNTRFRGVQYHGTSEGINRLYDTSYSPENIYGQGLYTTDAYDVAQSYTGKGKGKNKTVYETTPNSDVKLYDLEKPMSSDVRARIDSILKDTPFSSYDQERGTDFSSLREVMDNIRAQSQNEGWSTDRVQELFDSVRSELEAAGYRGYSHVGGRISGRGKVQPHNVNVYWFPEQDISLTKLTPSQQKTTNAEETRAMREAGNVQGSAEVSSVADLRQINGPEAGTPEVQQPQQAEAQPGAKEEVTSPDRLGKPGASTYAGQEGELQEGNWKEASFATRIYEGSTLSQGTKEALGKTGALYYKQVSHVQTEEAARAFAHGKDPLVLADLVQDPNADVTPTVRTYLGQVVAKKLDAEGVRLQKAGDAEGAKKMFDRSAEVAAFTSRNSTEFGRAIEITKTFDPSDPDKVIGGFTRLVDDAQNNHKRPVTDIVNEMNGVNEEAAGKVTKTPRVQNRLRQLIRTELDAAGVKLGELVRQHYTVVDRTGKTLEQKIVENLGLSGGDAAKLAGDIRAEFQKMVSEKKKSLLDAMMKKRPTVRKVTRGVTEKIVELSNLGAMSNQDVFNIVSDKLKIPNATPEILGNLRRMAVELQSLGQEMTDYGYSLDFWKKRKELEDYYVSLTPSHKLKVATGIIGRGNMVTSVKSWLTNQIGNSVLAGPEMIGRRLTDWAWTRSNKEFASGYRKYVAEVFDATGYDPTRLVALEDTQKRLGEEMTVHTQGPGRIRAAARFYEDFVFKTLLGKPDVKFSAWHFTDSADLNSTKLALKLVGPNGDYKAKALEIFKDAVQIAPETEEGQMVRNRAIYDATRATYTDDTAFSKTSMLIRRTLNEWSGDFRLGDQMIPFAKTPANVVYRGAEAAGLFLAPDLVRLVRAYKAEDPELVRKAMRGVVASGLGMTAAVVLANLMTPDDYIDEYFLTDKSQRSLIKSLSGTYAAFRYGKNYISSDYFGPIAPALSGLMTVRKYGSNADAVTQLGMFGIAMTKQLARIPGVNELSNILQGLYDKAAVQKMNLGEVAINSLDNTADYMLARTTPAILSDIAKAIDPYERQREYDTIKGVQQSVQMRVPGWRQELPQKIDLFSDPIEGQPWWGSILFGARYRFGRNNEVFDELSRLQAGNQLPSISDIRYTSTRVKALKAQLGDDEFNAAITRYGQLFKDEATAMMSDEPIRKHHKGQTSWVYYSDLEDEEKKKEWNNAKDRALDQMLKEFGYAKP